MSGVAERSRIADLTLAPEGERKIRWAARHMPVLNRLAHERLGDGTLRGRKLALVLHLESKTAHLATLLADAGAHVVLGAANAGSTQDSVCAALVARGLEVHGSHGATEAEFEQDLLAVAATAPEIVLDDGAELTRRMLSETPALLERVVGVTEQTTTGVQRLKAMEAAGRLRFPAIAANDAWSKHLYDNKYGTGQSTIAAILRLTDRAGAGMCVCVIGYGWVGKGLARYAEGVGARVSVVEVDPVPALEAHMDGHRVASFADALPAADVVITATGGIRSLGRDHIELLKDGVVLANAGHHDLEIDVDALHELGGPGEIVRPDVGRHTLHDGRRIHLLADGRLVNIAAADGHPVEIIDLTMSVQALAAHVLAAGGLEAGVHRLPVELDREIARTKLAAMGIALDAPTDEQLRFLEQWAA